MKNTASSKVYVTFRKKFCPKLFSNKKFLLNIVSFSVLISKTAKYYKLKLFQYISYKGSFFALSLYSLKTYVQKFDSIRGKFNESKINFTFLSLIYFLNIIGGLFSKPNCTKKSLQLVMR